mgnify:CR=1 FL=1
MTNIIETDVLVIGEGSAGQVAALAASEAGADVVLLFNGQASSTAISTGFLTYAAHDGFPKEEVFDAMSDVTGKGLCDTALLRRLVDEAPAEMGAIIEKYSIPVDRAPRGYRVRRSTGMRGKDILDETYGSDGAEDMTGLMMEFSSTHGTALFSQLRKAVKSSSVRRIKGSALSLQREGPSVWADLDGSPVKIAARAVILATGGMQGVYEFTDTPQNLLGDGQSMALEAGAEDFQADEEGYEIVTDPSGFEDVHSAIEAKGISCEVAHITQLPTMTAPVDAITTFRPMVERVRVRIAFIVRSFSRPRP